MDRLYYNEKSEEDQFMETNSVKNTDTQIK